MQEVAQRVKALGQELADADAELTAALATLPNPPDPTAADADTVLREVGEKGASGPDHLEIAGSLINAEAGARVSGSRFAYLMGDLVLLEFALVRWGMSVLAGHGFTPVIPPVLVREDALYGTGFLPDTEQQIYTLPDDELYLVGTSEVPLASLHAGEILEEGTLPLRYAGFSSCFRREAGAAGRDTRGIFRVHQFDKLEMFCFVEADQSGDGARAAAGDRGGAAAGARHPVPRSQHRRRRPRLVGRQEVRPRGLDAGPRRLRRGHLDVEHHRLPGAAAEHPLPRRRRRQRHVHTLNGTAVTWRHMIALLENGQRDDGPSRCRRCCSSWGAPAELRVEQP